jgi:hypothetical protein
MRCVHGRNASESADEPGEQAGLRRVAVYEIDIGVARDSRELAHDVPVVGLESPGSLNWDGLDVSPLKILHSHGVGGAGDDDVPSPPLQSAGEC